MAMPYAAWASATSVEGAPLSRSTRGRMCATWQAASNHSREAKSRRVRSSGASTSSPISSVVPRPEPVRLREHGEDVEGRQRAPTEPRIGGGREREVNVAALEARGQTDAAVLDEVHLDAGVPPPIARKETGEQGLHRLRRGAHPEHACLPSFERPRPLAE